MRKNILKISTTNWVFLLILNRRWNNYFERKYVPHVIKTFVHNISIKAEVIKECLSFNGLKTNIFQYFKK